MRCFMEKHSGERVFVSQVLKQTRKYKHFTAWEAKSIWDWRVDDVEGPFHVGIVSGLNDFSTDTHNGQRHLQRFKKSREVG